MCSLFIYKVLQVNCTMRCELSHNMLLKSSISAFCHFLSTCPAVDQLLAMFIYWYFIFVKLDFSDRYESCCCKLVETKL